MIRLSTIINALREADIDLWFARKQSEMIGTTSGRKADGTPFSVNEFYIFCNPSLTRIAIKERRQHARRAVYKCILACVLISAATRHGGAA